MVGFPIIGNLRLSRFLPATLDCYSLMKSVISVGVDNVLEGRVLYMCSLLIVSDKLILTGASG